MMTHVFEDSAGKANHCRQKVLQKANDQCVWTVIEAQKRSRDALNRVEQNEGYRVFGRLEKPILRHWFTQKSNRDFRLLFKVFSILTRLPKEKYRKSSERLLYTAGIGVKIINRRYSTTTTAIKPSK